jgi:5,10-methenyltetrahydrofolate synthetase
VADPNEHPELRGAALHEAKRALRERVIRERDAQDPAQREAASRAIAQRVLALPSFAAARCVLLTLPFRSEWDTRPLVDAALARQATVALPRVDQATRMLELHRIGAVTRDTAPGYRGIVEPLASLPRVALAEVEWVLVPGVAFDASGRRLGYGGGYYDRLLDLFAPAVAKIAGAFDCQVVDAIPHAAHDLTVDAIATPTRLVLAG